MTCIDRSRLSQMIERETAAFYARTPRSAALVDEARTVMPDGVPMAWMVGLMGHRPIFASHGEASRLIDADGNSYIDFNLVDLSNTVGYGENAISRRVAHQAAKGMQFMLPCEDAIVVSRELKARTGLPFWQYTISASSANAEIIRIARAFTGRDRLVLFGGKYHGHIEPTMADGGEPGGNAPAIPEALGISSRATADTVNVPFNDLDSLERALAPGDVALVMIEPALTNCGLVLPDPGFLEAACGLAHQAGALFSFDETHTWQLAFGGFIGQHGLAADFVALGKGLGSGMPLGAYGMSAAMAAFLERNLDVYTAPKRGLAIGGTTFGSAITLAAARAMLEEVATPDGYDRIAALGARLADGIDAMIARHGLAWRAFRYGPRSGFCLMPDWPRNYAEAHVSMDEAFCHARRLYMANRGIWEAISSAGPQVSFAHTPGDVDRYVELAGEFLAEITA